MRLAVMQPYIFPYVGYFQLIYASDKFVFYDDVDFIKGGWINRNKLLVNGKENLFTIPLKKPSSFKLINEIDLHPELYNKWRKKIKRTLEQSYSKAPYYEDVIPIIYKVLDDENGKISDLAIKSILSICEYLNIDRYFYISSEKFSNLKEINRSDRLIEMAKNLNTEEYINMEGGKHLYDKNYFSENFIQLKFLKPKFKKYDQGSEEFFSGLSIIDILMFNNKESSREIIKEFELV